MVFASECSSVRFLRERASEELQSGALTGSRGRRISSGMEENEESAEVYVNFNKASSAVYYRNTLAGGESAWIVRA